MFLKFIFWLASFTGSLCFISWVSIAFSNKSDKDEHNELFWISIVCLSYTLAYLF